MIANIVSKLRQHLTERIDDEPGVVYLLCEVRKLLEHEERTGKGKRKKERFALLMFCHWALHVNLTRSKTTLEFLQRVDNFVVNTVAGFTGRGPWTFLDEHRLFRDFVYLDTFRSQLKESLDFYALPTDLCDEDDRWFAFLSAYASVIEDGSLSSECSNEIELTTVERVVFRKGAKLTAEYHVPFKIQWYIYLRDGRILRTEVSAQPVRKMMFHKMSLERRKEPVNQRNP